MDYVFTVLAALIAVLVGVELGRWYGQREERFVLLDGDEDGKGKTRWELQNDLRRLELERLVATQCERMLITALWQIAAQDPHSPGWRQWRAREALREAREHAISYNAEALAENYKYDDNGG